MRFCEQCRASFQSQRMCPRDRIQTRADIGDPLLGHVLGDRYRVLDRIAAGGMGQVYRAAHTRIASLFALKVLYGDLAHDDAMRARFAREAEASSLLASRYIVRVLDFGETPAGLLYLAMEFIEGTSLANLVARERALGEARTVALARQVARGLAHAHERGIVHRDLKSDNVLVTREDEDDDEVCKLLDFGLAQLLRSNTRLTHAGQVFGTPHYMAPEQFFSADVDGRADLYALGVMMFEMATGELPFDAPAVTELARKHATVPPPALRAVAPGVSPQLEAIVMRLLAKRPDDRFASARAVLDALRALGPAAAPATSATAPAPSVPAARPASLDAVRARIERAIMAGAPTYNAGNYAGCYEIYKNVAGELLAGDLAAGPAELRERLTTALARAQAAADPGTAAWEMRYALDDLIHAAWRASANAPAPVQDGASDRLRRPPPHAPAPAPEPIRSATPQTPSFPPIDTCPALDRVAERITQAIGRGAPAFNAGDVGGCLRIYRQTAAQIISELGAAPACAAVAARLRAAAEEASRQDDSGGAWAMRRAFDEILAAAARRRS